ncbi:MAG: glycosyltransferase, partial [Minisyncoccia bacterium]
MGTQGGGERVLNTISKYLISNGNDMRFLVTPIVNTEKELLKDKSEWVEPFKSNKDKTFSIKIENIQGIPYPKEYKIIKKFFEKEFIPDVIIVTSPFFPKMLKKAIKKTGISAKIVGWYHGSLFPKEKIRSLVKYVVMKRNFKFADAHFAISSGIKEQILKIDHKAKVYTVFNPLDSYNGPLIQKSHTTIFLYVGRLFDPQKNLSFMFKGLSMIKKDWKLIIVGTGPDEEKLKSLSNDLGISQRIEWRGFKKDPYENLNEGVTALLLTSRFEGFGMVLAEANQRGIPVISS